MTKQIKEIGKATEAEIEVWKGKHKEVFQYKQTDADGNVHYTYVRKPNLADISMSSRYAITDPVKANLSMFSSCRLGGSDEVVENDEMKQGIIKKLSRLFKSVEAEELKL